MSPDDAKLIEGVGLHMKAIERLSARVAELERDRDGCCREAASALERAEAAERRASEVTVACANAEVELDQLRREVAKLRNVLGRIKIIVCGEKFPHWMGDQQVTMTRAAIADIIDPARSK